MIGNKSKALLSNMYQKKPVIQTIAETESQPLLASEQEDSADQMHLDQTTEFLNFPIHEITYTIQKQFKQDRCCGNF